MRERKINILANSHYEETVRQRGEREVVRKKGKRLTGTDTRPLRKTDKPTNRMTYKTGKN